MKITFAAASIIGFSVGVVCGCYEGKEASLFMQSAEVMSIPAITSDFALGQFEHADQGHAHQAVVLEIKLLEQLERVVQEPEASGGLFAPEVFRFQLILAYTRLALIEETAGQTDAARRDLDQAKARFNRNRPDREVTDEQLKDTLRRFDAAFEGLPKVGS
ncbi:MAG: hypothetical protein ABSA78_07360 [Candidatus Sulfotelmatobacter sp.]|jgi:hypothetical protein